MVLFLASVEIFQDFTHSELDDIENVYPLRLIEEPIKILDIIDAKEELRVEHCHNLTVLVEGGDV
jgi:hypothetical protein